MKNLHPVQPAQGNGTSTAPIQKTKANAESQGQPAFVPPVSIYNAAAKSAAALPSPFQATAAFDVARAVSKSANQLSLPVTNNRKLSNYTFQPVHGILEINADGHFPAVQPYLKAVVRINARAASLGYAEKDRIGDVSVVPGGYTGHYPNYDIYTSNAGSTFEVHGDIRNTYNSLGGPDGILGFPVSNETATPDGAGRYNHFTNGSVYWSPRTGPAAVWGKVRDAWAASGWERGPMGYPIENQHRMIPIPATDPIVEWCRFENGMIAGDPKGAKIAPAAVISHAQLQALLGNRINNQFKASPNNVALRSNMEAIGVTDYTYNYPYGAVSRAVGFRLHGFHDNGLATDTDFSIDIWLRFELCAPFSFTEPVDKTLVAVLHYLRVDFEGGLPIQAVIDGVRDAINGSFHSPDPDRPEVPDGAVTIQDAPTGANVRTGEIDLLDVLISAGGDLQFFVNPLTPPKLNLDYFFDYGHERQRQLQDKLDSM